VVGERPGGLANDSSGIIREPDLGYCVMVGEPCQYAADHREFDEGEREPGVVLDDSLSAVI
jgi:hypothetical protein